MPANDDDALFDARMREAVPSCDVTLPTRAPDVAPAPQILPCDPQTEEALEVFSAPGDPPDEEELSQLLPSPITVINRPVTFTCPGEQVALTGSSPFLQGSSETELVYLDDIAAIAQSELFRLGGRSDALQAFVTDRLHDKVDGSDPTFAADLAVELGVTEAVSAAITAALVAAQARVDSLASVIAQSQATCGWNSLELWVTCDDESDTGYAVVYAEPVGEFAHSAADVTSSTESQANADEKAALIASRELDCQFTNDEGTVNCTTIDASFSAVSALDGDVFHTADTIAAEMAGRTLYYTATMAAGDPRTRAGSKVEANAIRDSILLAELDCFFPSAATVISCLDTNDDAAERLASMGGYTEDKVLNEMVSGDDAIDRNNAGSGANYKPDNVGVIGTYPTHTLDTRIAWKVTLPVGLFVGGSQAEADGMAENHALAFLQCVWISPAWTCGCVGTDGAGADSFTITAAEVEAANAVLDTDKSNSTGGLPRGQFVTPTFPVADFTDPTPWGDPGGDHMLASICEASLLCVYESCAMVCCTPQPDDRPRMTNNEVNVFNRDPSLSHTQSFAAWQAAFTAPVGCSGGSFSVTGCEGVVSPLSLVGPTWAGAYPPNYGTPAAFRFGGVLQYGNVWSDDESRATCNPVDALEQEGDENINHYSCAEGKAVQIGSIEGIYDQAKADATARLNCDHTFWGRTMRRCPNDNQRAFREVNITQRIYAQSTKAANIEAENVLLSLLQCEEVHPFKLTVVDGVLRIGNPTAQGKGGGLKCNPDNPGLRPLTLRSECDGARINEINIPSRAHIFVEAICCDDSHNEKLQWIVHIEDSAYTFNQINANIDNAAPADAMEALDTLAGEEKKPVYYIGSVARSDENLAPGTASDWSIHQNLSSPIILSGDPEEFIPQFHIHSIEQGDLPTCKIQPGFVTTRDPTLGSLSVLPYIEPLFGALAMADAVIPISEAHSVYCKVLTNAADLATSASISSLIAVPVNRHAQPERINLDGVVTTAAITGEYWYRIASFHMVDGVLKISKQYQSGGPISHVPGRNGIEASYLINDCDNNKVARIVVKQGQYTSIPGTFTFQAGCDNSSSSSAPPDTSGVSTGLAAGLATALG